MTIKSCTKCGIEKPITDFYKQASKCDGLYPYCKTCSKSVSASYLINNKDSISARNKEWQAKNPENKKKRQAAYRAANYIKINSYRNDNKDKIYSCIASWRHKNKELIRIYAHNYRARKNEVGGKLSNNLKVRLFKLQSGKCPCCGKPLGDNYHLDHIMPLALGGKNEDNNIQLLRQQCNNQKHAKHPVDFMQSRGFLI